MLRLTTLFLLMLVLAPAAAEAASCERVRDPYAGTRFEGVDLTRVRAEGTGCDRARRVARGAHRKGLSITPPASGVRRYRWRGWRVRGDLRPASDRYVASKDGRVVRWRF